MPKYVIHNNNNKLKKGEAKNSNAEAAMAFDTVVVQIREYLCNR